MTEGRCIQIFATLQRMKTITDRADEYFNLHMEDLKKIRFFTDINEVSSVLEKLCSLYSERLDRMAACKDPEKDLTDDDIGLYFFTLFVKEETLNAGCKYYSALEELKVIKKEQIN